MFLLISLILINTIDLPDKYEVYRGTPVGIYSENGIGRIMFSDGNIVEFKVIKELEYTPNVDNTFVFQNGCLISIQ